MFMPNEFRGTSFKSRVQSLLPGNSWQTLVKLNVCKGLFVIRDAFYERTRSK